MGSWLKRYCECRQRESAKLCAVHRAQQYFEEENFVPGQRLFPKIDARSGLAHLKRCLILLKAPNPESFTWKCVRAGKATSMAAANVSLPDICEAGEWQSKKTPGKHYVSEDVADHEIRL